MAKIRYLQQVGSIQPGEEKDAADNCARVLVLIGKAEYVTAEGAENAVKSVEAPRRGRKRKEQQ
ncbi:hypothetical protein FRN05_16300 [Salmonella enterica subsp. enterica]|nr:hypothetical protein [Salmonella enterica subsp. enterica serovar Meleagridis]EHK4563501.1 hypothetical protein [Salmonella enterica]EIF8840977.1 hypothetical protein [Salmonella enterica]